MSLKIKYVVLFYLLINLHASTYFDFSYASCSKNPFVALIAAASPEYPPHCLTGAIEQAHVTMEWERLMILREQYRNLSTSGQFYNDNQRVQHNQQLRAIAQEISKLSWVINKIPNPHFVVYFHPFHGPLKQQIIHLWQARLKSRGVTPQILEYAQKIEATLALQYNIYVKKVSPHAIDHKKYTFVNCADDILLAFTAAIKATDHPKCLEGALLRLKNRALHHQRLPYFDTLPPHLQSQIEDFLRRRYYFKSTLPNLGPSALSQNQVSFGHNGFWMLGSEATLLQSDLEKTQAYQNWYHIRFPMAPLPGSQNFSL